MVDRFALRLAVMTAILAGGACADVGGDSEPSDRPADAGTSPRPSTPYDGGTASWRDAATPAGSGSTGANGGTSSNPISLTVNDAAVSFEDLLNAAGSLFGGNTADGGAGSGSSSSPAGDGGAAGQCVNAPCTTASDCQQRYPSSCGFTSCQVSVCR